MLPLSQYLNGPRDGFPASRFSISRAAYFELWIATWATPGRLLKPIMSPTTNTSGYPGRVRSALTPMRPARSKGAPV